MCQAGQAFIGDFVRWVEFGQTGEALQVAEPGGGGPGRQNQRPELVQASQEGEVIVGQIGPVKVEQGDVAVPVRLNLRALAVNRSASPGEAPAAGLAGRLEVSG